MRKTMLTVLSQEEINRVKEQALAGAEVPRDGANGSQSQQVTDNGNEPVVQFIGPLGEAVTEALQKAYDKSELSAGGEAGSQPAMESQANDALGAGLDQGQVAPAEASPVDTIAYVVNENTVDVPTVIDAAQQMDQSDEDKDFILIIDGTMDPENGLEGTPKERQVELATALESIAKAKDIPVYRSVKDYLNK